MSEQPSPSFNALIHSIQALAAAHVQFIPGAHVRLQFSLDEESTPVPADAVRAAPTITSAGFPLGPRWNARIYLGASRFLPFVGNGATAEVAAARLHEALFKSHGVNPKLQRAFTDAAHLVGELQAHAEPVAAAESEMRARLALGMTSREVASITPEEAARRVLEFVARDPSYLNPEHARLAAHALGRPPLAEKMAESIRESFERVLPEAMRELKSKV